MCLPVTAKNFGLHVNIAKPQGKPLIRKTGWGNTERETEKEGGRMQCFTKKEDKSLIE